MVSMCGHEPEGRILRKVSIRHLVMTQRGGVVEEVDIFEDGTGHDWLRRTLEGVD